MVGDGLRVPLKVQVHGNQTRNSGLVHRIPGDELVDMEVESFFLQIGRNLGLAIHLFCWYQAELCATFFEEEELFLWSVACESHRQNVLLADFSFGW